MKTCRKCLIEKDEADYYADTRYPDGLKAVCRKCHYEVANTSRKKKRLREKYVAPPLGQLSIENNLIALQRMAAEYAKKPGEPVYARTKFKDALFPTENGAKIAPGKVGPVLDYQTATGIKRKSLSIDPLLHIATEMAGYGIEILWESLPPVDIPRKIPDNNSQERGGKS